MIANRSINLNSEPESWQKNAHDKIMAVIKNKDQITYNALAATANMTGPYRIHRLTSWLEQLMAEDQHNDRPLRAAVVISKARGGLPAPGFFDKAKELGLNFDTTDRRASYEAYLQTVYTKFSES